MAEVQVGKKIDHQAPNGPFSPIVNPMERCGIKFLENLSLVT
jgi:hypothetical protein